MLSFTFLSSDSALSLLKLHCAEWKSLYANEIKSRHNLGILHRLENNEAQNCYHSRLYISGIQTRHLHEINELNVINREKRLFLKGKQELENAAWKNS
ncbi:hypothetical protein [Dyadobacter sp. NIV53]|uniref:hypothetical protein n=1 Tax=Dyadobacter sp. NIV53 TaxID=2861765 RepID=UPI001C8672EB|nr:hypothetical protein [Dyadobacter sp. NIV53]